MSEEKTDAFEAALAAASVEPVASVIEAEVEPEVIDDVVATSESVDVLEIDAVDSVDEGSVESDLADEDAEDDPNAEFRRALRNAAGEWFVVHSYAGYEKKVKANLQNRIQSLNMEDFIFQIEVPEEEVTEIKNGQRKQVKRNIYPGYVLVRMDLSDESCLQFVTLLASRDSLAMPTIQVH